MHGSHLAAYSVNRRDDKSEVGRRVMRVLVVDDESLAREGVRARLAPHRDMCLVGEAGDGQSAVKAIKSLQPDLVFMDIEMPGQSGIDVLRCVASCAQPRPLAILLTAYDSFAIAAFELNALDYLLKPIDDQRFREALDRARSACLPSSNRNPDSGKTWAETFTVRIANRTAIIKVSDIDWIEASDDYAGLHVGQHIYLLRESLHLLSQRLDPKLFLRIHRSTIVRIERIAELEALSNRDCLLRLRDGTPLRVSRTYVDTLRAALAMY